MAEAAVTSIQCGFCLTQDEALEDPKALPCSHIHCFKCLMDNYDINSIVKCPLCSEVFDTKIDSLPGPKLREDNSTICDICSAKGLDNKPAVTYCTICTVKYCNQHELSHDKSHGSHIKLTIDMYILNARKLQPRFCTEHEKLISSIGCRRCFTVACVACELELDRDQDGTTHNLMSLDKLADELMKEIDEVREKVMEKEGKLLDLFKLTAKIIAAYDAETEDMIRTLHGTCGEKKYKQLEGQFLELRENVKFNMTEFMEGEVGIRWSDVNAHRLKTEAGLKCYHQVDIVNKYENIRTEMEKLVTDKLPTLELLNMVTLEVRGQTQDLEAKIVFEKYGFIDIEHGLSVSGTGPLPKSITLLREVVVDSNCNSVTHYKGNIYLGFRGTNTVKKICENSQLSNSFLTLGQRVAAVTVHKDRIYTLVFGSPRTVHIHDLEWRFITSWNIDSHSGFNRFTIVDNQIVIPDRSNTRLTVYSLSGKIIKHVPCYLLNNVYGDLSICAANSHAVIISSHTFNKVFKVDISTAETCWEYNVGFRPGGVTCSKSRVYVTSHCATMHVWIADEKTGELLTKISDPAVRIQSHVLDLCIFGNTLVVPRYHEKKVLFYKLE